MNFSKGRARTQSTFAGREMPAKEIKEGIDQWASRNKAGWPVPFLAILVSLGLPPLSELLLNQH